MDFCAVGIEIVKKQKIEYLNIPAAFDIETSSFFRSTGKEPEKIAIMYEWSFCINGGVIVGRKWLEFIEMMNKIIAILDISPSHRLVIYIHNLGYEFQFMRKYFEWENVFSIDTREPVYAVTKTGIEFRCSYILSGYSLATIGKNLRKYKVEKMVGDLDYSKIRNSITPLTDKEIGYCVNDVKIVVAYIQEKIEQDGDITKLQLTKTGYVRKLCRDSCFGKNDVYQKGKFNSYNQFIKKLVINTDEYSQLKRAFYGGFTHASAFSVRKIVENVHSYDFTSSYPAVMVSEQFPLSRGEKIIINNDDIFYTSINNYCCLFDVKFTNIQSSELYEQYISESHCRDLVNPVINNGRIFSADELTTTITEQDFIIIKQFYKWDEMSIGNFIRYKRGYLPTRFISAILDLYQKKTELKNVDGKEVEYMAAKENINSCYGMCVTDICRDEILYDEIDENWSTEKCDFDTELEKYNKSKNRFLFYPWGLWVTAYARKNLFTAIYEYKEDYIYSDTDSVKVTNAEKHLEYINGYNADIKRKLSAAMKHHGLPENMFSPKTIEGKIKTLGVWDDEGEYQYFKTLGAKRYMTYKNGKMSLTVAGLNKNTAVQYIEKICDNDVKRMFDFFDNEMYIPAGYAGKMTHTYIDEPKSGEVTDYLGNTEKFSELSAVHLENADYSLSMVGDFINFVSGIQEKKRVL